MLDVKGFVGQLMRLQNKISLITGGTSGIGEATALLFAKEGASVAITGRNEKRGHAVTERILQGGGKAIFIRTDVRKAAECRRAVDETLGAFGKLDILFNNAGVFYPHTTLDCSEEEWDLQLNINLKGTFLMSKFALPPMIRARQRRNHQQQFRMGHRGRRQSGRLLRFQRRRSSVN